MKPHHTSSKPDFKALIVSVIVFAGIPVAIALTLRVFS